MRMESGYGKLTVFALFGAGPEFGRADRQIEVRGVIVAFDGFPFLDRISYSAHQRVFVFSQKIQAVAFKKICHILSPQIK